MTKTIRKALATVLHIPATVFILIIRLYQVTLSPDHSWLRHLYPYGYCRHEPTCSRYALHVLRKQSLPVALWKIAGRILSCHPWTQTSDERLRIVVAKTIDTDPS